MVVVRGDRTVKGQGHRKCSLRYYHRSKAKLNIQAHEQLKSHIWEIANRLRGPYRPPQYRLVMLPDYSCLRKGIGKYDGG